MSSKIISILLFSGVVLLGLRANSAPDISEESQQLLVPKGEPASGLVGVHALSLGRIEMLVFSHAGRLLASGAESGQICIWDLSSGRPLRCIQKTEASTGRPTALAWSPQDHWLAAGQADGSVELLRTDVKPAEAGCQLKPLSEKQKLGRAITSLVFTGDGSLLAFGGLNGSGRICKGAFETANGPGATTPTTPVPLASLAQLQTSLLELTAMEPSGQLLAAATSKEVGVWKIQDGSRQWLGPPLPSLIISLAVSQDGKQLATGFLDGGISLWEVQSGKEHRLSSTYKKAVRAVAFSPDGSKLAVVADDQGISLWETRTEKHLRDFGKESGVAPLAFRPDGELLASASASTGINIRALSSGEVIQSLRGNADQIKAINFGPQGLLLATASDDQQVRIWKRKADSADGPDWSIACNTGPLQAGSIHSLAFQPPDGKVVAIAMDSPIVRLLNVEPCSVSLLQELSPDWVKTVAFSKEGRWLAAGSDDGTIQIWNFEKNRSRRLTGHKDGVLALAFSREDESILASGSYDKSVRLWNVANGKELEGEPFPTQDEGVKSVDFSPDGKLLALASTREVGIWDVGTRKLFGKKLLHDKPVTAVRWNPDGKLLGTAAMDGQVLLWELASQQPQPGLMIEKAVSPVLAIDFSPSGDMLAAAGPGRVKLWKLPERTELAQLWQGGESFWASWTADGKLYRHDLGALLMKQEASGELTPVLPPSTPAANLDLQVDDTIKQTKENTWVVTGRIHNAAKAGRAYWLRLEESELPEHHDLRDSLNVLPGKVTMRLEPDQALDFTIPISIRGDQWPPKSNLQFCLTVRHAHEAGPPEVCKGRLSHEVSLDPRPWWLRYAWELASAFLIISFSITLRIRRHRRGYSHPVIQGILSGENPLPSLPLREFPDADAAMRRVEHFQKGLRSQALKEAGIDDSGWHRALSALDSPESAANKLSESLLANQHVPLEPFYQSPELTAFHLTLPRLSIRAPREATLLISTAETMTPQAAVSRCKPEELQHPKWAFLFDLPPSQLDAAEVREVLKDAHPGVVFVVLSQSALKRILVAKDTKQAKDALHEAIVGQCELRQIEPYPEGNGIEASEENLFFGRQSELDLMLTQYRRNFLLVGPRQMGKSSLLNALGRELARGEHNVKVLKHQLYGERLETIREVDREVRADSPEAFYESVMSRGPEYQIFLLDEVGKFIERESKQQYPFCNVMRALHGQGRASFVLTGNQELHDATRTPDHPLRNFGELLRLEPLDYSAAEQMILDPLTALGLRFAEEARTVDWLCEQTGRRPHLLSLFCSAILHLRKQLSPMDILLQEVKDEVQSPRHLRAAFGAWEKDIPLVRAVTRAALLLRRPLPAELVQFLKDHGVAVTDAELDQCLSRLYAWHYLLIPDEEGRLYCPVPLFQHWLTTTVAETRKAKQWESPEDRLRAELEVDFKEMGLGSKTS